MGRNIARRTVLNSCGRPAASGGVSAFTDDFNRADANLGTPWSVSGTAGAAAVRSNQLASLATAAGGTCVAVCTDQGSPDQYVEFTLKSNGTSDTGSFVICRATADGNDFIGLRVGDFFAPNGIEIYRRVGGTLTAINTGTFDADVNDVLRFEVSGTGWELFRNGVSLGTGSIGDGGALASNTRQGVWARLADQNPWVDDFEAGAL